MASQRVRTLHYRISSTNETTYRIDKAEEFSNLYGRFQLGQNGLTWWPELGLENSGAAIEYLAPYLRAWEIQSDLDCGPGSLRFFFESAELQETEASSAPGSSPIVMELHSAVAIGDKASSYLTRTTYPAPPTPQQFGISQYVELAHGRWLRYVQGREPLPSMAYFIYTILYELGGRSQKSVAAKFEIDKAVLNRLSELSSVSGDAGALRKFGGAVPATQMPDAERAWLEEVVKQLIRRLGEYAAGAPFVRTTMADLPALP